MSRSLGGNLRPLFLGRESFLSNNVGVSVCPVPFAEIKGDGVGSYLSLPVRSFEGIVGTNGYDVHEYGRTMMIFKGLDMQLMAKQPKWKSYPGRMPLTIRALRFPRWKGCWNPV